MKIQLYGINTIYIYKWEMALKLHAIEVFVWEDILE